MNPGEVTMDMGNIYQKVWHIYVHVETCEFMNIVHGYDEKVA